MAIIKKIGFFKGKMTRSNARKMLKAMTDEIRQGRKTSSTEIRVTLENGDYTQTNEKRSAIPSAAERAKELERASREFLSSVPAGIRFHSRTAPTQRLIKAASSRAQDTLGNSAITVRKSLGKLGPFSNHSIAAEIASFPGNTTRSSLASDKNAPPSDLFIYTDEAKKSFGNDAGTPRTVFETLGQGFLLVLFGIGT